MTVLFYLKESFCGTGEFFDCVTTESRELYVLAMMYGTAVGQRW